MSIHKDLSIGFKDLIRGFVLLVKTPKLWPWALMPTVINFLLLAIMLAVFIHNYGAIYGWLSSHMDHLKIDNPTTWYWYILNGIIWFVDIIFQVLLVLVSLILLLITSYGIGIIIASPFNDALSERVERLVLNSEGLPFSFKKFIIEIIRIVKIESLKAVILVGIPVVLFVINFIPVVGSPIYIILTFIFGAWSLGFSYADLPMGRRVVSFSERMQFAKIHKWKLVGLGAGFAIPFFGLICVAPMVVGGTLLYIECKKV